MTWWNAGAIGVGLLGTYLGSEASNKAANTQESATNQAAQLQQEQFNQQIELQKPFRENGLAGQNRLMELLGIGGNAGAEGYGKYAKDFSMQDFQQDPGYGFRMSEGLKGLDRQAAARGGLISGGALKAAQRYGQDLASQEYGNAFNRYQTNRTNQLNPLQSLGGLGQSSTNMMGQAGQNYANQVGEAYTGAGNARASGYMGQANAISGGLGQMYNGLQNNNMMRMFGNQQQQSTPQWGVQQALPYGYNQG